LLSLLLFYGTCPNRLWSKPVASFKKTGNRTQLIVKDRPFLVLGGELGNSTATSMENMQPVWQRLKDMNLNTVLVPVYWELVEPRRKKV
jgi:hypothetical protein